jgi:hypothetical protein
MSSSVLFFPSTKILQLAFRAFLSLLVFFFFCMLRLRSQFAYSAIDVIPQPSARSSNPANRAAIQISTRLVCRGTQYFSKAHTIQQQILHLVPLFYTPNLSEPFRPCRYWSPIPKLYTKSRLLSSLSPRCDAKLNPCFLAIATVWRPIPSTYVVEAAGNQMQYPDDYNSVMTRTSQWRS